MDKNILITGTPGVGKTTALKRIVSQLKEGTAGGFWSSEIRERGQRVGFAIETLDGQRGILAHTQQDRGPRVGRYRVNVYDVERIAVPSMVTARERGLLVVVDEIARMELFSSSFRTEIAQCLGERCVLGTLQMRRDPFLDEVRKRPDVSLIELTPQNRDLVPREILSALRTESTSL
jgi:nucleoside-triphosphatase